MANLAQKKIRIGFDISQVAHFGGVSQYTQNLALSLQKNKNLEMTYFYSSLRKSYNGDLKNVKKFKLPPTLFEFLFNRLRNTNIEKFLGVIDIFHSSDWVQPPTKAKKVTTYHDVIPLKFPEWSHPRIVDVHKRRLKIVEKEIDAVIAVSESTKNDLIEISSIPEEKIFVIYEGVEEKFRPQPQQKIAEFKEKYNLPKEFVLAIGGVGERKNLDRIKKACKGFNLIISGQSLPYVLNQELPLLYASAKVLIYTTLYEGFGLPIVEAMACGVPVITSNRSSMKEIATGFALLVDPENIDQMHQQLNKLLTDENLRNDLITKGLKYSKKFSWQEAADKTVEVYQKLLA